MKPHTYEGAKRMGKALKREFDAIGADVRLTVCQKAVAAGVGFESLEDMGRRLMWEGAGEWSPRRAADVLAWHARSLPAHEVDLALRSLERRFSHWN